MKLCTKFGRNRAIRGRVIAILVLDLMTLSIALRVALGSGIIFTKFDLRQLFRAWIIASLYKIWAKSNNPRLNYWRFSTFSRAILGGGHNWQSFLRGVWTQLHQTWPGHRAIIAALHFCFRIRISCCIFQRMRLRISDVIKRSQISHFPPPSVKIRRWARSLYIVEALLTTKPPTYISWLDW